MKTLSFIFLSLIYAHCYGQQKVNVKGVGTVTLPAGAERLVDLRSSSGKSASNKESEVIKTTQGGQKSNYIFKGKDYVFMLNAEDKPSKPGQLISIKKALEEVFFQNKTYTSSVKTTPQAEVLLIQYVIDSQQYYNFYAFKRDYSKGVTCVVFCDKDKSATAKKIIDQLYLSLSFKN